MLNDFKMKSVNYNVNSTFCEFDASEFCWKSFCIIFGCSFAGLLICQVFRSMWWDYFVEHSSDSMNAKKLCSVVQID